MKRIVAFVNAKLNNLMAELMSDTARARLEMHRRVSKLFMRAVETVSGFGFEVTGDIALFSSTDAMHDTSPGGSVMHCVDDPVRLNILLHSDQRTQQEKKMSSARIKLWHAGRTPEQKEQQTELMRDGHAKRRKDQRAEEDKVMNNCLTGG